MGACIFDCGLFDGVKRLHHKPLVYDEFCGKLTVYFFIRERYHFESNAEITNIVVCVFFNCMI